MKHAKPTRAWRPVRAHRSAYRPPAGVLSALVFNLCLFLLPVAGATALLVVNRDQLYAYEYSQAGARAVAARVERLNGELIQLDFDRQRQWDDLVAMELMAGDVAAARGFLLSARGMLPGRVAAAIEREAGGRGDAGYELAALEFLTPATRSRYEGLVPLLSRRAASGAAQRRDPEGPIVLGDERDFEMLARAALADPSTDMLQFVLTGMALGHGGEFTPRMARGAAALLMASRRDDYPPGVASDVTALANAAMPAGAFRAAALASADGGDPGAYAHAAAGFRDAIVAERAEALARVLDEIGEAAEATSVSAAAALLTHATSLAELPRLKLVALAAGDRAAAAAKRLPRDGRLLETARGELTVTRALAMPMAAAGIALLGLLGVIGFTLYRIAAGVLRRMRDDDYGAGELIDISGNWRPS